MHILQTKLRDFARSAAHQLHFVIAFALHCCLDEAELGRTHIRDQQRVVLQHVFGEIRCEIFHALTVSPVLPDALPGLREGFSDGC